MSCTAHTRSPPPQPPPPPRAQRLAWLTGFTGSAGLAVVLTDAAALFVDGRYTLQARDETPGELFEKLQPGVTLDLAVEPQLNAFNGRVSVELEVKDLQFA